MRRSKPLFEHAKETLKGTAMSIQTASRLRAVFLLLPLLASCVEHKGHEPTSPLVEQAAGALLTGDEATEVAIVFRSRITEADRAFIATASVDAPIYEFRGFPGMVVRAPLARLELLRAHPRVRFAETGSPVHPAAEVISWHFNAVPFGHGIQQIHDEDSFGDARYGDTIGIAVVGTGIACYGVFDFLYGYGNSRGCAGGVDFTGEGTPFTDVYGLATNGYVRGHDTQVASLILASVNNGLGIRGIAPRALLYSLRIFDSNDNGSCIRSAQAIDYATYDLSTVVSIINASYGAPATTQQQKDSYEANCQSEKWAVANAVNSGRFISASAGNVSSSGDSVVFPARLPGVAAVSGLTCCGFGGAAFWSGSARGAQVAFAAGAANHHGINPLDNVVPLEGTSFAAPIVSGIVAAVQSRYNMPRIRECVLEHLKNTAYRRPGWSAILYGAGMVNGYAAWSTTPPTDCAGGPV